MKPDLLSRALTEARLAGEVASLRRLEARLGDRIIGADVGETHAAVLLEVYEEVAERLREARAAHDTAHTAMMAASA